MAINVGHPEGSDRLEQVLSATLRSVFGNVARDPMEPTNTILMAGDAPLSSGQPDRGRRAGSTPTCKSHGAAGRLAAARPGLRGGAVYTDDRAPVEWLVDESLVEYAAGG